MAEFLDTEDELNEKYSELYKILDKSQNISFFTGAGISTAAKIPGNKFYCIFSHLLIRNCRYRWLLKG